MYIYTYTYIINNTKAGNFNKSIENTIAMCVCMNKVRATVITNKQEYPL